MITNYERALLQSIQQLGDEAYGVPIRQMLSERLGRDVSYGMLYAVLALLQDKSFVSCWDGGATAERSWRPKRFFKLTPLGNDALAGNQAE